MTWAICLNCGDMKFGAMVPCPTCHVTSVGNLGLDIAFTDHRMAKESLEQLSAIMLTIRRSCADDELCFWAFIHYVAVHHPTVLAVDLKDEIRPQVEAILRDLNLTP